MFLGQDLVVAIGDIVCELGMNLENHGSLVGNGGHRLFTCDLHNEVGVVAADGAEVAIRKVGVETDHIPKFEERRIAHFII